MKCKKGYKFDRERNRCIKIRKIGRYGIKDSSRNVRKVIMGMLIFLAFLFAVNLGNVEVLWALGFNMIILGISYLAYRSPEYQESLIGIDEDIISTKSLKMIGFGLLFTFGFYIITLLIPGMSIGFPLLPQSISSSIKFILINIISPITETIFFIGVIYAVIKRTRFGEKHPIIVLTLASLCFAGFHLGAYILGFYQYPDFVSVLPAFWANVSAFVVAFLFNMIAGGFTIMKGVKNLIFAMIFHLGLNSVNWFKFAITIVHMTLPLMIS